ncbi:MAG: LrgB family protein [Bacteroidota bacterium]
MTDTLLGILFGIVLTLAFYYGTAWIQRRTRLTLLNPVLVSVALLIALLLMFGIEYETYDKGGRFISFFLAPSVVALGVPLYLRRRAIMRRARSIFSAIIAGSAVGVLTAAGCALLLGASRDVVLALAPRSVTTPIAIGIARQIGGIEPLTAVIVIASGIFGSIVGPGLLRRARIRSGTAFGLALGASSHGIGTARAIEEGPLEAASSGLAIGLMGVVTAVLVPVIMALFEFLGWL